LNALNSLLFFATWTMFAACIALFLLRKFDMLLNADATRSKVRP